MCCHISKLCINRNIIPQRKALVGDPKMEKSWCVILLFSINRRYILVWIAFISCSLSFVLVQGDKIKEALNRASLLIIKIF